VIFRIVGQRDGALVVAIDDVAVDGGVLSEFGEDRWIQMDSSAARRTAINMVRFGAADGAGYRRRSLLLKSPNDCSTTEIEK
jgi:hypothetical protein